MRRQPYTEAGLARVPCRRCGEPFAGQWHLRPCALPAHGWYGLCAAHDLELNRLVVDFLNVPNGAQLLDAYEQGRAA